MLDLTIHGDLHGVRRGLDRVNSALAQMGFDANLAGTVEIVLAEVMNNIVEHAYAGRGDGLISLQMAAGDAGLNFTVTDRGHPLPKGTIRKVERDLENTPVADLPEGGFGWQLIQNITEQLDYRRVEDTNQLCFQVPVTAAQLGNSPVQQTG